MFIYGNTEYQCILVELICTIMHVTFRCVNMHKVGAFHIIYHVHETSPFLCSQTFESHGNTHSNTHSNVARVCSA